MSEHLVRIPRHACSPRDRGRAGDLWRLVQEVAVADSAERGWPPERYREMGTGFVVRELVGVHHRESIYGEELRARTWIRDIRRGVLMHRETRIEGVLSASAEWVHVAPPPGVSLAEGVATGAIGPARGSAELIGAFPAVGGEGVRMPDWEEIAPIALPTWTFSPWWTEMDPMGHTNHPRYVDWADELVSRALFSRGVDPVGLVPVAERVRFRAGARAGEALEASGAAVGIRPDAVVFAVRVHRGDELVADVTLVRGHLAGPAALLP